MIGSIIDQYQINRLIGQGGMGRVFEATHLLTKQRVALKILKEKFSDNQKSIQRLFIEAKAISKIEHPGLVQILNYRILPDGSTYIAMEYLEGETLGQRLKSNNSMSLSACAVIACQIASVLCAAHSAGIIHCDVKPDNIFLVPDPVFKMEKIKILDFGIAKFNQEEYGVTTESDQVIGSPVYMAPEQFDGRRQISEKVDVYSLGIILYEIIAGTPPFVAASRSQIIGQHVTQPPPDLYELAPSVPDAIHDLVHEMLEKLPAKRPTMGEVLLRLERRSVRHTWHNWMRRPFRRAGRRSALLVLGALVALTGGVWQVFRQKQPQRPIPMATTPPHSTPDAGRPDGGPPTVRPPPTTDSRNSSDEKAATKEEGRSKGSLSKEKGKSDKERRPTSIITRVPDFHERPGRKRLP